MNGTNATDDARLQQLSVNAKPIDKKQMAASEKKFASTLARAATLQRAPCTCSCTRAPGPLPRTASARIGCGVPGYVEEAQAIGATRPAPTRPGDRADRTVWVDSRSSGDQSHSRRGVPNVPTHARTQAKECTGQISEGTGHKSVKIYADAGCELDEECFVDTASKTPVRAEPLSLGDACDDETAGDMERDPCPQQATPQNVEAQLLAKKPRK